MVKIFIVSLLAVQALCLRAAGSAPEYLCMKTNEKIIIDGVPDEPAWEKAVPAKLKLNKTAGLPKLSTVTRMLWDDHNLYISFVCEDPDVWATMGRHDMHLYREEAVEAFINADCNPMTYVELQVNPLNARFDALVLGDNYPEGRSLLLAYNPVSFQSAVKVFGTLKERNDTDKGWSAEMAISFNDLGYMAKPTLSWICNLYRIDNSRGKEERSALFPTLGSYHAAEKFGKLTFVEIRNGRRVFASHSWKGEGDNVNALDDGVLPESSDDAKCLRFTWWPHKGSEEWVEFRFLEPREFSESSVYWFDDTAVGGLCGLPESWRIQYLDAGKWKDVENNGGYAIKKDSLCRVKFKPIKTTAVRLLVKLQADLSTGMFEWQLNGKKY